MDCGYVETGPLGRDRSRGPTAIPTTTSSSSSTAVTHGPLHGQEETPEILLSAGEVDRALRAFNGAVQTKVETLQPNEYIRASALVESLQLTLRLTTVFEEPPGPQRQPSRLHQTSSTPTSGTAPGRRERDNELHQRLRGKANSAPTEGKYKNRTVYEAYLDRNYVNWIMDNINENSGRGMKQLKQVIVNCPTLSAATGSCLTRTATIVPPTWPSRTETWNDGVGPEQDLVCVVDTGCNVTCHGDRWLQRYLALTHQNEPGLEDDNGGGFRGIGGRVQTRGVRELELCLELGLCLLPGCLAYYSRLAEEDLASLIGPPEDVHDNVPHDNRDNSGNSDYVDFHHHVEEDNDGEDTTNDLGFLAIDEMRSQHMTQKQAQAVRNNVDELKKKDRLVWNNLCPGEARRRPALPRGCKTFLFEVFAGCAMLSTLAHYAGLPVSEPVDLLYDPLHNLQTKAGRDYVEARIAADDPYLVTFAPVSGPWSSWQHVNMAKNPEMAKEVLSKRQAWKPVIRWMAGIALDRLKRGRQVLIENPKGSELWNLWDMMKLLSSPEAMDSSTLEHFERVNIDLCAYGLQDSRTKMMHKKPTSIATCSRTLKAAFEDHGRWKVWNQDRSFLPESQCTGPEMLGNDYKVSLKA